MHDDSLTMLHNQINLGLHLIDLDRNESTLLASWEPSQALTPAHAEAPAHCRTERERSDDITLSRASCKLPCENLSEETAHSQICAKS